MAAMRLITTGFLSLLLACRQGGRHTTGSAYFSLPVAFPSAILSTVALGENNCLPLSVTTNAHGFLREPLKCLMHP